jgi:hypothetical protein
MSLSEKIRERLEAGMSTKEIRADLGCNGDFVRRIRWIEANRERHGELSRRRARKHHHKTYVQQGHVRPWTDAEDAALMDAIARGDTYVQIADSLGRSKMSIAGRLYKLRAKGAA